MGLFGSRKRATAPAVATDEEQLRRDRVIHIRGPLGEEQATELIAKLLFLQHENPMEAITLLINSTGGSVVAAMAIIDTIKEISPPVWTCCHGNAHGTAAILLACGQHGNRSVVRSSMVSLTQVTAASPGVPNSNLEQTQQLLAGIIAKVTGHTVESVQADMDSDRSFDPTSAVEYGLADLVVE